MENKLQITFWGGVGTVTGANILLETLKTRLLVDCGLLQGTPDAPKINHEPFPYEPATVNFLFLTHAHADHIGRVCKLVKDGFRGTIYSTPETQELSRLMFADAIKVMESDAKLSEAAEEPLYGPADVDHAMKLWKTIPYHLHTQLDSEFSVYLKDAGHILGSSMYEFSFRGRKIAFTGDSGNTPSPLLQDTEPITDAHYLVVDSVYGDRNHEPKAARDEKFRHIVMETIEKGGALVIPAFSIERTQVILYELNNLIEDKKIPSVPVFLDSPLGAKVTGVYARMTKDFNAGVRNEIKEGDDIFNFPKLTVTHGGRDSQEIAHVANPKIIIAGSGMSSGGRVLWHEELYLPDPNSTLLLMGYQALGTLGRTLQNKPKEVEIHGQKIPVNARIEMISGYSSHKDSDSLVAMVEKTANTVKKVFVIMGEPKASTYLAQRIRNEINVEAVVPTKGVHYEL